MRSLRLPGVSIRAEKVMRCGLTGTQFVVDVAAQVAARHCGPVLVKETGVPTAPAERDR